MADSVALAFTFQGEGEPDPSGWIMTEKVVTKPQIVKVTRIAPYYYLVVLTTYSITFPWDRTNAGSNSGPRPHSDPHQARTHNHSKPNPLPLS